VKGGRIRVGRGETINGERKQSISHKVDHVRVFDGDPRSRIALEIEWNNKDPFFDRDLENFKRFHRHLRRDHRHARDDAAG